MNLGVFYTVDPRVFILKETLKIKQDVASKSNLIGNLPLKDKPTPPILLFVLHFDDNKTYDFTKDDPQKLNRRSIIDQNKKLIIYSDLKDMNTLYFNTLISV